MQKINEEVKKLQKLPENGIRHRNRSCDMSESEIITILLMYHFGDFKISSMQRDFPKALSYCRFIQLVPRCFMPMMFFRIKNMQQFYTCFIPYHILEGCLHDAGVKPVDSQKKISEILNTCRRKMKNFRFCFMAERSMKSPRLWTGGSVEVCKGGGRRGGIFREMLTLAQKFEIG
ncbi:MAG: hypothetical protein LBS05_05985 [Tannerellaceae bacterium]|nr:hypothetical protein [Tannerellaceae bacterium]